MGFFSPPRRAASRQAVRPHGGIDHAGTVVAEPPAPPVALPGQLQLPAEPRPEIAAESAAFGPAEPQPAAEPAAQPEPAAPPDSTPAPAESTPQLDAQPPFAGPVAVPPQPELDAQPVISQLLDQLAIAGAKPFAQEPRPVIDPIFGTPIDELHPWIAPMTPPATETPVAVDPGSQIDIEVLGSGYQVNGTLTTGKFERLSDWLNMQQGWCNIQNGTLFRPGHEDAAADRPKTGQWVRLDHIVLVAERQTAKRDRRGPYVRKERRRVTMVTQDYMLRGYIHLVESGSMQQFLESPDPHFLPMTDVTVRWLVDETVVSHYPFALVNRDQLISVSEDAVRDGPDVPKEEPAEIDEATDSLLRSA